MPRLKKVPGEWLLDVRLTKPELSVALGSVHVTMEPAVPKATCWVTSLMQAITGATLSTGIRIRVIVVIIIKIKVGPIL